MNSGESSYRRYLDGDKSGFDEIIDLYHDSLIYFLKRYVVSDPPVEVLIQEFSQNKYLFRRPSQSHRLRAPSAT